MAILIYCLDCNRPFSRKLKNCPKCGKKLRNNNKFWVNVVLPNGKRRTKVVEGNLTVARKVEASMKKDIIDEKYFGIKKAPLIIDIWEKYQEQNRINLNDFNCVSSRWSTHIEPYISSGLKMDQLTAYEINKILDRMRGKGGRKNNGCAPATIKHVLGLIKRLYNWAWENDLYEGENPTAKIKPPK